MGKGQPRYVQTVFSETLHERSADRPLYATLCGQQVHNFTRSTPADGFKFCDSCARITQSQLAARS
jgi:hypothetical protein